MRGMSITRHGSFKLHPSQWTLSMCGDTSIDEIKYSVRIEASSLNDRGFIIDGSAAHDYFTRTYMVEKQPVRSCEDIAEAAVNYFRSPAFAESPVKPTRVLVTIQGNPWNVIEAEWRL